MIVFAWRGFPQYAARCVGAFAGKSKETVVVVATRPKVPIEGMELLCGCRLVWIDGDADGSIEDFVGEIPRVVFASGWIVPAFNRFCSEVCSNGGRAFCMIDNNYSFGLRELVSAVRFRMQFRGRFDGYMVPGHSGARLLNMYGVENRLVVQGLYAADSSIFKDGLPLDRREKKIIYVGQFIARKNVVRMVRAFAEANLIVGGDWTLDMYGCGPLRDELAAMNVRGVNIHSFVQPDILSGFYRRARVFCLPSLEEHWGLVVHEAALSGCMLLLSNKVGASEDLIVSNNGFVFNPTNAREMKSAFVAAMTLDENALAAAHAGSLDSAKLINIDRFVAGIDYLLNLRR